MKIVSILILVVCIAAGPATQPRSLSELEVLRAEVKRLRAENLALRAQMSRLQSPATQQAKSATPATTDSFEQRWAKEGADAKSLQAARNIDVKIADYLSAHTIDSKVEQGLHDGKVTPGMTEEELKLFGICEPAKSESVSGKRFVFDPSHSKASVWGEDSYVIDLVDGKVVLIQRVHRNPPAGLP